MPESEFWQCELREIFNRINGFFKMERSRQEQEWERARWQSAIYVSVFAKKGVRIKPRDLIVFPWEDREEARTVRLVYSKEERTRKFDKMDRFMKKINNGQG